MAKKKKQKKHRKQEVLLDRMGLKPNEDVFSVDNLTAWPHILRERDWLRTEAVLNPYSQSERLFIHNHYRTQALARCKRCGNGRDDGCSILLAPPEPEKRLLPWSTATVCSSRPAWSRSSISLPMTSSLQSVSVRLCRGSGSNPPFTPLRRG